eukprot:234040_1
MQATRCFKKFGGTNRRLLMNKNILNNNSRRFKLDYQSQNQSWEPAAWMTLAIIGFLEFTIIVQGTGSMDLDKLLPFSFGTVQQDMYFPPHCQIFTPYNKMKEQQKRKRQREREGI